MKHSHLVAVLAGLAVAAVLAADASAMYHPTVGRFMQRDPLGNVDGAHLYHYVQSNPVSATDSRGLSSDKGWDDPARLDRSAKIIDKINKEEAAKGVSENTVREAFAPNIYPDCPRGVCPCPLTKTAADAAGWEPDPSWVSPWLHPGSSTSYKKKGDDLRGDYKERGNQCTYDKQGNLITHGPGAGTPDRYGGRELKNMWPHWEKDVKNLFEGLQTRPGANRTGVGSLPLSAIADQVGIPAASPQVDAARTRNAVGGWKDIMRYQLSKGGFYLPCVPKDAPENWGDWKFEDGQLKYTGSLPDDPGPPEPPRPTLPPGTSGIQVPYFY
jgi:hypothetical protein